MNNVKHNEYALLDEIAQNPTVTQAGLSSRLGIAVGSVNWYIKRLIQRGWVKVTHLDRTRLKYDLTSEGMSVFTQRAVSYARNSLKVYSELRNNAKTLIASLKAQGIHQVFLEDGNEAMDILRLTCLEAGIALRNSPDGLILKTDGQNNYEIKLIEKPRGSHKGIRKK